MAFSNPGPFAPPVRRRRPVLELCVRADLCTACGACTEMCPLDAIQIESVATIDHDRCGQCGACIAVCPEGAIDWPR